MIRKILFYSLQLKKLGMLLHSSLDLFAFFNQVWNGAEWIPVIMVSGWIGFLKLAVFLEEVMHIQLPFGMPNKIGKRALWGVLAISLTASLLSLINKLNAGIPAEKAIVIGVLYAFLAYVDIKETMKISGRIDQK